MKVMTVLGTRPEIIRLSRVIAALDESCEHSLVHTGQNFDHRLDGLFFEQLGVRAPDYHLSARGSFGTQVGHILDEVETLIERIQPDRFLILGDTTSGLSAVVAKRLGVPVYHMEAGNRCFDDRVPEEVNRRIIDHSSDVLMPYTERSRQNLLREGFHVSRIYVTGNPIYEVIQRHEVEIDQSTILDELGLVAGKYYLVTLHRAENVDVPQRLENAFTAFDRLQRETQRPVIVSTHPRTRERIASSGQTPNNPQVRFLEPFSFFDFIHLEQRAACVLTDSGTVQEECAIFAVPNVTLRDVTERPETLECGSNVLSGLDLASIQRGVALAQRLAASWTPPPEYVVNHVSDVVTRIVLGYRWERDRVL